jgi:uncharacterized protein (TIGR02145 family)
MKILKSIIIVVLITTIVAMSFEELASKEISTLLEIHTSNKKSKFKEQKIVEAPISNEVIIGNQVWMTRNLNVDKFRNGDPIPYARTPEEWKKASDNGQPAWCYYDMEKYGKLYNWYAINDPRGLAPKGWRIPTDEDWIILTDYLGGGEVAGGKMKSTGTKFWKGWEEEKKNEISRNKYATNESGFTALPGGTRNVNYFQGVGRDACWWSSTEFDNLNGTYLSINHLSRALFRSIDDKISGNSVRCIKENFKEQKIVEAPISNEVIIGNQVWMTRNLNVDKFRNGDPIPYARTPEEWKKASDNQQPAWCIIRNDSIIEKTYGKLYNWYAVNDSRGLAPKGWHIPSDVEWSVLIDFLGGKWIAGEKMKSKSSRWSIRGMGGNGTNLSGFNGQPGGFATSYNYIGAYGFWWSSTSEENDVDDAWCYNLSASSNSINRGDKNKSFGLSVRCVKN